MQAYVNYAASVVESDDNDNNDDGSDEGDDDDSDYYDDGDQSSPPSRRPNGTNVPVARKRAPRASMNADIARQRLASLHATLTALVAEAHTNDIKRWLNVAQGLVQLLARDGVCSTFTCVTQFCDSFTNIITLNRIFHQHVSIIYGYC
jgi:hypothetical protein